MIVCKAFEPGLVCRGYQFHVGLNTTDEANCRQNGFHCAANPLDCLSYYSNMDRAEYWLVDAGGDVDEDEYDSKVNAATENQSGQAFNEIVFMDKDSMLKSLQN